MKSADVDIIHLIRTLGADGEINSDFGDDEMCREAARLVTTARRLAREAGYDISNIEAEHE